MTSFGDFVLGAMAAILSVFVLILIVSISYTAGQRNWDLNQRNFVCAEDEYLGYHPRSTTHVVCLSDEQVYGEIERRGIR